MMMVRYTWEKFLSNLIFYFRVERRLRLLGAAVLRFVVLRLVVLRLRTGLAAVVFRRRLLFPPLFALSPKKSINDPSILFYIIYKDNFFLLIKKTFMNRENESKDIFSKTLQNFSFWT